MLSPMLDDNSNVNLFQMDKRMSTFIPKISIREKSIEIFSDNCFDNKSFRKTKVEIKLQSQFTNLLPNYVESVNCWHIKELNNILPKNLTKLTITDYVGDTKITTLPINLKCLDITGSNCSSVIKLAPENLNELSIFAASPDSPIKNLPKHLKKLHIIGHSIFPLNFPNELEYLHISCHPFDHDLLLPNSLKELYLGCGTKRIIQLPLQLESLYIRYENINTPDSSLISLKKYKQLKILQIKGECNKPIEFPDQLKELQICSIYNHPLELPESLEKFTLELLEQYYDYSLQLPKSLKMLYIDAKFTNPNIILPESLEHLILENKFNHPIQLPKNLKTLEIYGQFNQLIELPHTLKELIVGGMFNMPITLPTSLQSFITNGKFNYPIVFPNTLKKLIIGNGDFDQRINIPPNLDRLEIDTDYKRPIEFITSKKIKVMNSDDIIVYNFT
jgi:hypothetical protein